MTADLAHGSLHEILARAGFVLRRGAGTIDAAAATAEDARLLALRTGDPLLVERRVIEDGQGRRIEATESRYAAARYGLAVQFDVEGDRPRRRARRPIDDRSARPTVVGRLVLDDRVVEGTITSRLVRSPRSSSAAHGRPTSVHQPRLRRRPRPRLGRPRRDGWSRRARRDGPAPAPTRVTSFLPTAVTAPLAELVDFAGSVRDWAPDAPADGAGPLGFNLEGPFLARPVAAPTTRPTCGPGRRPARDARAAPRRTPAGDDRTGAAGRAGSHRMAADRGVVTSRSAIRARPSSRRGPATRRAPAPRPTCSTR